MFAALCPFIISNFNSCNLKIHLQQLCSCFVQIHLSDCSHYQPSWFMFFLCAKQCTTIHIIMNALKSSTTPYKFPSPLLLECRTFRRNTHYSRYCQGVHMVVIMPISASLLSVFCSVLELLRLWWHTKWIICLPKLPKRGGVAIATRKM